MCGSVASNDSTTAALSGLSPERASDTTSVASPEAEAQEFTRISPPLDTTTGRRKSLCRLGATHSPAYCELPDPVNTTRSQVERLNRTLALVPYRKPVIGEVEFTSGFGVRSDPFLGRPAMHTGLDFRAAMGDPVRATANGKVVSSGWAGGYGRMVEIDHGNGLSTRYGHMSEISVKVGDPIKIGQVIGAVGSTGRSTGPHLHYETRIDGDAVDPQKFLRAGVRLSAG